MPDWCNCDDCVSLRRLNGAKEKLFEKSKITVDGLPITPVKPIFGHPRFAELTVAEQEMHERKNKDYAGGGKPTGNFDRVAQIMSLYPDFPVATNYGVGLIYMLKQLDAAMWLLNTGREGEVEGIADRLGDISSYAKLTRIMYEDRNTVSE